MAENLKASKYSDGTTIPNITDKTQWVQLTTGAWSYYNNDTANNAKYGKLYNGYAVSKTSNGNKNVCPTGWHVPTDAEWTVLTDYLGDSIAGSKMKEVGTTSSKNWNKNATNTSLFSALPGGYRALFVDDYNYIGSNAFWWSTTENPTNGACRYLYLDGGGASRNGSFKRSGFSVRCLRD